MQIESSETVQANNAAQTVVVDAGRKPLARNGKRLSRGVLLVRLLLGALVGVLAASAGSWVLPRRWMGHYQEPAKSAGAVPDASASSPSKASVSDRMGKPDTPPRNPVYAEDMRVSGLLQRGRSLRVLFDDGTVADEKTPGLESVSERRVVVRGRTFAVAAAAAPVAPVGLGGALAGGAFVAPALPAGAAAVTPAAQAGQAAGQVRGSWRLDSDGVERLVDKNLTILR